MLLVLRLSSRHIINRNYDGEQTLGVLSILLRLIILFISWHSSCVLAPTLKNSRVSTSEGGTHSRCIRARHVSSPHIKTHER